MVSRGSKVNVIVNKTEISKKGRKKQKELKNTKKKTLMNEITKLEKRLQ